MSRGALSMRQIIRCLGRKERETRIPFVEIKKIYGCVYTVLRDCRSFDHPSSLSNKTSSPSSVHRPNSTPRATNSAWRIFLEMISRKTWLSFSMKTFVKLRQVSRKGRVSGRKDRSFERKSREKNSNSIREKGRGIQIAFWSSQEERYSWYLGSYRDAREIIARFRSTFFFSVRLFLTCPSK